MYKKKLKKECKGFTLVELLIVIIILAIIAGVAIPSFLNLNKKSKIAATMAEMSSIALAISLYRTDFESYPATDEFSELQDLIESKMAVVPSQDKWKINYNYSSDGTSYILKSSGPDKTMDNSDDLIIVDGIFEEYVDTPDDSILAKNSKDALSVVKGVLGLKDTNFSWLNWNSSNNPTAWNLRIERLIQQGSYEKYDKTKEGTNARGYVNPFSGKTSVYDWQAYSTNWNKPSHKGFTPPAVLITNEKVYDYNTIDLSNKNILDSVMGTMIIFKSDNSSKTVQLYYIDENGNKSALEIITP